VRIRKAGQTKKIREFEEPVVFQDLPSSQIIQNQDGSVSFFDEGGAVVIFNRKIAPRPIPLIGQVDFTFNDAGWLRLGRALISHFYLFSGDLYPSYYKRGDRKLENVKALTRYADLSIPYMSTKAIGMLWNVKKNAVKRKPGTNYVDIWKSGTPPDIGGASGTIHHLDKSQREKLAESDLSIEDVTRLSRNKPRVDADPIDPLYLIHWIIMQDSSIPNEAFVPSSKNWSLKLEQVFSRIDQCIRAGRAIVLGCTECYMRSPTAIFLYFLYIGIPWRIAYTIVANHSTYFFCVRKYLRETIPRVGKKLDHFIDTPNIPPVMGCVLIGKDVGRKNLKEWLTQKELYREAAIRYFANYDDTRYAESIFIDALCVVCNAITTKRCGTCMTPFCSSKCHESHFDECQE
jgi:hypothetical protein